MIYPGLGAAVYEGEVVRVKQPFHKIKLKRGDEGVELEENHYRGKRRRKETVGKRQRAVRADKGATKRTPQRFDYNTPIPGYQAGLRASMEANFARDAIVVPEDVDAQLFSADENVSRGLQLYDIASRFTENFTKPGDDDTNLEQIRSALLAHPSLLLYVRRHWYEINKVAPLLRKESKLVKYLKERFNYDLLNHRGPRRAKLVFDDTLKKMTKSDVPLLNEILDELEQETIVVPALGPNDVKQEHKVLDANLYEGWRNKGHLVLRTILKSIGVCLMTRSDLKRRHLLASV